MSVAGPTGSDPADTTLEASPDPPQIQLNFPGQSSADLCSGSRPTQLQRSILPHASFASSQPPPGLATPLVRRADCSTTSGAVLRPEQGSIPGLQLQGAQDRAL